MTEKSWQWRDTEWSRIPILHHSIPFLYSPSAVCRINHKNAKIPLNVLSFCTTPANQPAANNNQRKITKQTEKSFLKLFLGYKTTKIEKSLDGNRNVCRFVRTKPGTTTNDDDWYSRHWLKVLLNVFFFFFVRTAQF